MEIFKQPVHWDNSSIYKNFEDPQIEKDIAKLQAHLDFMNSKASLFSELASLLDQAPPEFSEILPLAIECHQKEMESDILLGTISTFSRCALSINSQNQTAKDLSNRIDSLENEINKASKSFHLFLLRAPESFLESFFQDERTRPDEFILRYNRQQNDYLLSVPEEVIIEGLSYDGFHSWARLYSELAGTLKAEVDGKQLGLAELSNWLFESNRERREKAYRALNKTWKQNEISVSYVLNSIYGSRIEQAKLRSSKRPLHYLDQSCHQSRITKETLEALIQTTYKNREVGHKALRLMAQEMGEKQLGPWDTLAGSPLTTSAIPYQEALQIVISAFNEFSPDMGQFVQICADKNWIEATPTENRGAGAYCTKFINVREPRVFMTYDGSMKNVMTLAHELGHAYHSWVMRELPIGKIRYPMTLAETASIFGETLVRKALLNRAQNKQQKKEILWQDIESAANLLINIPARYEFEKNAMELRKSKSISASEFSQLTTQAWEKWYEKTLTEYNEMFWASKMHFSFSGISFYNYPYLFGYLFSLGIYAQKEKQGSNFIELYHNILKDTGRMTAEDLILKHLNQDISKPEFWQASIDLVSKSVDEYEGLS